MPPTTPPATPAICPVICSSPLSGVTMVSSFGLPDTLIEPRDTVMPMSALDNRLDTGLSFLPTRSRGAAASRLRPMA